MNTINSKVFNIPSDVFESLLETSEFYTKHSEVTKTDDEIKLCLYPANELVKMILVKDLVTDTITGYYEGTKESIRRVHSLRRINLEDLNMYTRTLFNYTPA